MGVAIRNDRRYTYQDYCSWPDEERWEIIDGVAYNMSPAPGVKHQKITGLIYRKLADGIEGRGCSLFIAPTDVVLDDLNVVQPDVFVVCDKTKITEKNIQGAPDLIVEVISPSTGVKDRREKKRLYERGGVKDYILISSGDEFVEWFTLKDGKYSESQVFNWDETMSIESFGVTLNLWEVFEKEKGMITPGVTT
ncbi:MAG: Uma2 family endonuclease, partial [Nitrospirales bacterium]|nr:Uma2 family endonuclease [Nitrospirales bacterium]